MSVHKNNPQHSTNILRLPFALILLFLLGTLSGCVSTSTYDDLNEKFVDVSNERDDLIKKQNALTGNTKLLRNKVESTEAQTARLKSELSGLQTKLSDASQSLKKKNVVLLRASKMLEEKNSSLSLASQELERRQSELQKTETMLAESNKKLLATSDYMKKTNKLYDDLVKELSTELEANQIKISEMKDGVTVNLSQDILFPSGSATLNKSGITVIKKVSGKLKDIPHQIIVAGFTDNVPIKGELTKMFPTNWELAGARSASVVRLLESQGIESNKLTAVSFGENQPVASNDDWKLRAQNRRIEIRLRPAE